MPSMWSRSPSPLGEAFGVAFRAWLGAEAAPLRPSGALEGSDGSALPGPMSGDDEWGCDGHQVVTPRWGGRM